jgi:hypothetical protein
MGLLDTLLGRTRPVRANLDALFALPGAATTLQVSCGLLPSGHAGVCFKPPSGQPFAQMQAELEQLLRMPDDEALGATEPPAQTTAAASTGDAKAPVGTSGSDARPLAVRHVGDKYGYRWIILEAEGVDDLVTRVHAVHSSLEDAGWSAQLLCSVFGFVPGGAGDQPPDDTASVDRPVFIVYLAKRGSFYPFAPCGPEQRDTEVELRLRSVLSEDLPIEADLSRWFPIWDIPIA